MAEDDDERLGDIDDATVPEVVREPGRKFRKPARRVTDLGRGEHILYADDGEVLDFVILR